MGGYVSLRLRQPSVLGELVAGLIRTNRRGYAARWPVFAGDEHLAESIKFMAELGVILLMLLAGLELDLSDLVRSGKVSAVAGTLGVVVPLGLGYGIAVLFDAPPEEAILVGLALSATSVSISAQMLMELGVLRSQVGLALLGAAVFDDILVILLLSIAFVLLGGTGGGGVEILLTIGRMILYLALAVAAGLYVLPWLIRRIERLPISQGAVAFVLVACLLFAWAAELLGGMAAITGAFLVGLFIGRTPYREIVEHGISVMAYGFFVPIFFINTGLEVNMREIGTGTGVVYALVLTVAAILGKIMGCRLGARLAVFATRPSLQLGIGMVSRGEVRPDRRFHCPGHRALSHGLLSRHLYGHGGNARHTTLAAGQLCRRPSRWGAKRSEPGD